MTWKRTALQIDGYSCGVFVLAALVCIAEGKLPQFMRCHEDELDRMRLNIHRQIEEHRLLDKGSSLADCKRIFETGVLPKQLVFETDTSDSEAGTIRVAKPMRIDTPPSDLRKEVSAATLAKEPSTDWMDMSDEEFASPTPGPRLQPPSQPPAPPPV